MAKIVVIGSSNTDMVVKTKKFPAPGETILGGEFFMFSGGKGANQAVAAARMGGEVTFISKIGNDIFGHRIMEEFKKEGIVTDYIDADFEKASGIALIIVDVKGENEIVVASGANETLSEQNIIASEKEIASSEIVLLQLEVPLSTVLFAAKMGYNSEKKVILNPAPAKELPIELFRCLYVITPNETEAEILTGIKVCDEFSIKKAAERLLEFGVQNVIITLGSAGAFFKNHETEMMVEAPKVSAIDTTGAGDIFNGVLAVKIAEGSDWGNAISMACQAATLSVTRMGAQASAPYLCEMGIQEEAPTLLKRLS
jgi:ribokinase